MDTDYTNWAILYNCVDLIGLAKFEDVILMTRDAVKYSSDTGMYAAAVSFVLNLPNIDTDTLVGTEEMQSGCSS